MPGVVNDMGALKRYGKLAIDGVVMPALGCACGVLYCLGAGIVHAFDQFRTTTWVALHADWAIALETFKAAKPK